MTGREHNGGFWVLVMFYFFLLGWDYMDVFMSGKLSYTLGIYICFLCVSCLHINLDICNIYLFV